MHTSCSLTICWGDLPSGGSPCQGGILAKGGSPCQRGCPCRGWVGSPCWGSLLARGVSLPGGLLARAGVSVPGGSPCWGVSLTGGSPCQLGGGLLARGFSLPGGSPCRGVLPARGFSLLGGSRCQRPPLWTESRHEVLKVGRSQTCFGQKWTITGYDNVCKINGKEMLKETHCLAVIWWKYKEQECIPVGCILAAHWPYAGGISPAGVSPCQGASLPRGVLPARGVVPGGGWWVGSPCRGAPCQGVSF